MNTGDFERLLNATGVAAREATPDDDVSDVLLLGRDFHYLAVTKGETLARVDGGAPDTPTRIVIDADTFSEMLYNRAHSGDGSGKPWWMVGLTTSGVLLQVRCAPRS